MAANPLIASRFAQEFQVISGSFVEIDPTLAWTSLTIDYGNSGSEGDIPSRSFVNTITQTPVGEVALILPQSFELMFTQDPLPDLGDDLRCSVRWINRRM